MEKWIQILKQCVESNELVLLWVSTSFLADFPGGCFSNERVLVSSQYPC